MGTSKSPAELAFKLRRAGDVMPDAARAGVLGMVKTVKRSVNAQLASAGVNGGRLRGVGKNGVRIGVRDDGIVGTVNPSATVRMYGPAHLIENDTKAHTITTKKSRKRRGGKAQALNTPHGPKASVQHPGTKGKQPWAKGLAVARPLMAREFSSEVSKSLRKVFR